MDAKIKKTVTNTYDKKKTNKTILLLKFKLNGRNLITAIGEIKHGVYVKQQTRNGGLLLVIKA